MQLLHSVIHHHPNSRYFEIDRVKKNISPEEFAAKYYLPQVPVAIIGIALDWPAVRLWTPEYLIGKLKGTSIERAYHFDIAMDHALARDCEVPSLIDFLRGRSSVSTRRQSMRVWISGKGTQTRWHYDGNSLQVANIQVRGRKRFSLISPETPLTCFGFGQSARRGYIDLSEINIPVNFTICEIMAGDMIFIPQHWYHSVLSLDRENLNINWVWTDKELLMASSSLTAIREREYLATLYLLGTWLRRLGYSASWMDYLRMYGGMMDFALTRELCQSVPKRAIARRVLLEFSHALTDSRYRRLNQKKELELNKGVRRSAYDFFHKPR
jgi:Cupin-like domain